MPVLFLLAIVVVLVGIFFAATGRGGEMSYEPADHAPLDLGPVSAADIALLRPPTAMWGYNMQVTDEALDQIARAMRERDVTIAYLQDQLAGYEHNSPYAESRGLHAAENPAPWENPEISGGAAPTNPETPALTVAPEIFGLAELFETRDTPEAYSTTPEAYGASPETHSATPEPFSETPETHSTTPESSGTLEPSDTPESQEAHQYSEDPEASPSPEEHEALDTPAPAEPAESSEPPAAEHPAAAAAAATQFPAPQQTRLTLKASAPRPEPHEATQPSQTLQDPGEAHDATEPSAALRDDGEESGEVTQPSASVPPDETPGPQGAFDTHGWWAEQKEAAREEQEQGR